MLKINFIGYLDPYKFSGGGEVVLRELLDYGRSIGHNIKVSSVSLGYFDADIHPNADLTILADIFNCPDDFNKFPTGFIEEILEEHRYIHIDNAYVDVCDLGYLPCSGNVSETCKYKNFFNLRSNIKRKSFSNKCSVYGKLRKKLYINSILNVFVSPLHSRTIHNILSNVMSNEMISNLKKKEYILKPIINSKLFFNKNIERDIDFLFVGSVGEAKGLKELRERFENSNDKLTIIGNSSSREDLSFANYLGFVPYNEMPGYFNRAINFIHVPRWPEPQGRVVIEAALCGCNIITNKNVGATSFEFNIENPINLEDVEHIFWKTVSDNIRGASI